MYTDPVAPVTEHDHDGGLATQADANGLDRLSFFFSLLS
jgi:hypothetical protein